MTAAAGITGLLAGIPLAAYAHVVPAEGRARLRLSDLATVPRAMAIGFCLATAAAAATTAATLAYIVVLPAFWFLAVGGVALVVVDVRRRRLPYAITGPLWGISLICFLADAVVRGNAERLIVAVTAGGVTAAVLLLIALLLPGQLGLGDVVFAGATTLTLGWLAWTLAMLGLLIGLLAQALLILALLVRGLPRTVGVPMGPALYLGWLTALVIWSG